MIRQATLIFDGDDTLWQTHTLYDEAKIQASILLNTRGLRVSDSAFIQRVDELSVEFGKRHGFISTRFPTSLTEAYTHFCQEQQVVPEEWVFQKLRKIGASVATKTPRLMSHAREVLETLSAKHCCVLYTLGDEQQQLYRLSTVSLASYFKRVFVVLHKDQEALMGILSELKLNPTSAWMIGNSASSDIRPALNLGLNCIWLRGEHWLFDDAELDPSGVHQILSLNEICPIIEAWEHREGR
jgi:putative hydrolase of the HAD superfamily